MPRIHQRLEKLERAAPRHTLALQIERPIIEPSPDGPVETGEVWIRSPINRLWHAQPGSGAHE